MSREHSVTEEIKQAVNDKDRSIGEHIPGTPFAIVALSYLGILAVVLLAIALVYWLI